MDADCLFHYSLFACVDCCLKEWRCILIGRGMPQIGGIGGQLHGFTWTRDKERLGCWVAGQTGFPFVDCFMRELEATGYTTHCGRECVAWFAAR